jgi:hypothetical protein
MKKQRPNGSILETGYRNALKNYFEYANIKGNLIPLIISFSDSYPHIKSNISKNANRIINNEILPRSLAYYQWDADTNCSEIWQRRFNFSYDKMMDDAFNESLFTENKDKPTLPDIIKSSTFYPEYKFILERLIRFSEPLEPEFPIINDEFAIKDISTIRSNGLKNIIYVKMKDGQNILFNHLPQGYKRLYSMVLDIAYRSYILNQNREPEGVVFIDEIELHLHPSLQQEVLNRFRKTFPKIQFIVSTHSPLVISNIKKNDEYGPNKIIKLSRVSDQYANSEIENLYGVDYITSLMEGMDSTYRLSTIDKLINLYVSLKYRDKEDEAGKIYDKLNELFKGNINQFIKKEIEKKIEQNQK